jgi:hypothetical protein
MQPDLIREVPPLDLSHVGDYRGLGDLRQHFQPLSHLKRPLLQFIRAAYH